MPLALPRGKGIGKAGLARTVETLTVAGVAAVDTSIQLGLGLGRSCNGFMGSQLGNAVEYLADHPGLRSVATVRTIVLNLNQRAVGAELDSHADILML